MKNKRPVILIFMWIALSDFNLKGELILQLGDIKLLPDTANQPVDLYIQNTGDPVSVSGLELNLQVGDGGPELADFGGLRDGPSIMRVDLINETLFASSQANASQDLAFPQLQVHSVDLEAGGVVIPVSQIPDQKLATLFFDTTGFDLIGESWVLSATHTLNGGSAFFDESANAIAVVQFDGSITIQGPAALRHVSGTVTLLENGSPVPDAKIIAVVNGNIQTGSTNAQGLFDLMVPDGASLRLGVELLSSNQAIQGVTTLDILLIRRFILNPSTYTELETTLLGLIGDVNRDGRVSTLDILFIRRLILNPIDFPFFVSGKSVWVFLRADLEITQLPSDYGDAFERTYDKVTSDIQNAHFRALKLGDVNGGLSFIPGVQ